MTHIFHRLYSNGVNEVCCGKVHYDGMNVPGPLPQWPERDSLQVVTQCLLTAGAQGGCVPVLQLRHPPQAGAVLVSSFQVFPPGLALWCLRSGWDDKHCPILSFGPALLLLVHNVVVSASTVPLAVHFLHREEHQSRLRLRCPPRSSLLRRQFEKYRKHLSSTSVFLRCFQDNTSLFFCFFARLSALFSLRFCFASCLLL